MLRAGAIPLEQLREVVPGHREPGEPEMPPFTVLHVCMGNICRSPMAERLLVLAVRERLAAQSAPASTGDLCTATAPAPAAGTPGEAMNPPAARQVRARGGRTPPASPPASCSPSTSTAPTWSSPPPPTSRSTSPRCGRTPRRGRSCWGEFGRLLPGVDPAAAAAGRADARPRCTPAGWRWSRPSTTSRRPVPPLPGDDLDDPWGRGDQCFSRVADEIEETVHPLATVLLP